MSFMLTPMLRKINAQKLIGLFLLHGNNGSAPTAWPFPFGKDGFKAKLSYAYENQETTGPTSLGPNE